MYSVMGVGHCLHRDWPGWNWPWFRESITPWAISSDGLTFALPRGMAICGATLEYFDKLGGERRGLARMPRLGDLGQEPPSERMVFCFGIWARIRAVMKPLSPFADAVSRVLVFGHAPPTPCLGFEMSVYARHRSNVAKSGSSQFTNSRRTICGPGGEVSSLKEFEPNQGS